MDKLSEPSFENDKQWPRLKLGVKEYIKDKEKYLIPTFLILAGLSCGRYYREITWYKKDLGKFYFLIVPSYIFTSLQLARWVYRDVHAYAALENNRREKQFQDELKAVWKEAKKKSVNFPDEIVLL
jgi:hypothetical protein